MNQIRFAGALLIIGAIGVFIPYLILSVIFNYPLILRQDPGVILNAFHAGGAPLIFVWLAFALLGLPLLAAYIILGNSIGNKVAYMAVATTIGTISAIVQVIGLLRWVFIMPFLATTYVSNTDIGVRSSVKIAFTLVHQFGGVLLGEHLGQLFTIIWSVFMARALHTLKLSPRWLTILGYLASGIYFLAQGELFATVIPAFPQVPLAGLIGSTLWLIWLILTGVWLRKAKNLTNH